MANIPVRRTFDFFTQQERNRRKTGLLVFLFVCAVTLIIAALYAAISAILIMNRVSTDIFDPRLLAGVAGGTIALVVGGSLFKTSQLKRGGAAVAEMLGGRLVSASTQDLKEKQLYNVVEEMSIASGTPMPDVYILDENGINACAAGWGTSDAAVCVTKGSLDFLSREELQGVIAHEFSHVHNGDMRLNIRLMGIIFGILLIAQIGAFVLRGSGRVRMGSRSSRDKGGGAALILLIALTLLCIGYIGVFFGNMIMAAVSRAREYLADASSVQFTRNPSGISGALKKIGGLAEGSRVLHPASGQASHLFFADGRVSLWSRIFATHPPLEKRIAAIDPRFRGVFPQVNQVAGLTRAAARHSDEELSARPAASVQKAAGFAGAVQGQPGSAGPMRFDAAVMLASTGSAQPEHIVHATGLIQSIPQELKDAMREPGGGQAIIFSLVVSKEGSVLARQMELIGQYSPAIAGSVSRLRSRTASLDRTLFMVTASLAVNSLKSLTEESYGPFMRCLKGLIEADGRISLFEYMVHCMIKRMMSPRINGIAKPQRAVTSLQPAARACETVLSTLVWESCGSDQDARRVFSKASAMCAGVARELVPRERCTLLALDEALGSLAPLTFPLKKQFLSACIAVVSDDGLVTVNEAQYVRAIADALECPIPPLVGA
jgi:Zn-dependent protease with chaperone function